MPCFRRRREKKQGPKASFRSPADGCSRIYQGTFILCVVLKRRLLEIFGSISGSVLLLAQFGFSRGLAVDTAVLLRWLFGVIRSPLSLRLGLQLGDFFLGLGDVLREVSIWPIIFYAD